MTVGTIPYGEGDIIERCRIIRGGVYYYLIVRKNRKQLNQLYPPHAIHFNPTFPFPCDFDVF